MRNAVKRWKCLATGRSIVSILALAGFALLSGCGGESDGGSLPKRILIDSIHAHNFQEFGLREGDYDYHRSHGYQLAFSFLKQVGIEHDVISEGTLTREKLSQYGMLFMNLPSADLPPFSVKEIAAIKSFIEDGGSALFITDHSNAYYHAWKLKPLFEELGMNVTTETAAEGGINRLDTGTGWIDIESFKEHPITKGLRHVSFQTGGTIDDRFAVAFTSDESWGDQWRIKLYGEDPSPAFFGDFVQQPDERQGPLGVIAAKKLGKGRIVVVADQNLFGDEFIKYLDNYRLFFNSANWLLGGDDSLPPQWATQFRDTRSSRVLCHEVPLQAAFGSGAPSGFHSLFVYLQRKHWVFATDDLSIGGELIILPDDDKLEDEELSHVEAHLRAGKPVLVLTAKAFAFTVNEGLTGQLVNKFGAPGNRKTTSLAEVADFEGTGRVVVSLITDSTFNHSLSKPDEVPTEDQLLIFKRIDALVELALQVDKQGNKTGTAKPK